MSGLTISQLAKSAAVNVATVRYYERRGLLGQPNRSAAGYRLYDPSFVVQIRFIIKAKTLGFTLKEVIELLDLQNQANQPCENLKSKVEKKISSIDDKINLLKKIKYSLKQLHENCQNQHHTDTCSVVNCISNDGHC